MRQSLAIVAAAENGRLARRDRVNLYLDIDQDADIIDALIDDASAACRNYLAFPYARRDLAAPVVQDYVESFRLFTAGDSILYLSRAPIVSVESVTVDGETLATNDYEFGADDASLVRLSGAVDRAWERGVVAVSYRAGYDNSETAARTLPDDLERACVRMIEFLNTGDGGCLIESRIKSISEPGVDSTQYDLPPQLLDPASGLPKDVVSILNRYKIG